MRTGLSFQEERGIVRLHYSDRPDVMIKETSFVDAAMRFAEGSITQEAIDEQYYFLIKRESDSIAEKFADNTKERNRLLSQLKTPESKKIFECKARNRAVAKMAGEIARDIHKKAFDVAVECSNMIEMILNLESQLENHFKDEITEDKNEAE